MTLSIRILCLFFIVMKDTYAVGAERCCPFTGNPGWPAEFEVNLPSPPNEALLFVAGALPDSDVEPDEDVDEAERLEDVDEDEATIATFSGPSVAVEAIVKVPGVVAVADVPV